MDRFGFHTLKLHSTLRHVDAPFSPSTAKVRYAPLLSTRLRPPALNAATKGTQGRLPPQFSSGTLFPHPRRGYAASASCLRQSVLNSSTARLPGRPPALRRAQHRYIGSVHQADLLVGRQWPQSPRREARIGQPLTREPEVQA